VALAPTLPLQLARESLLATAGIICLRLGLESAGSHLYPAGEPAQQFVRMHPQHRATTNSSTFESPVATTLHPKARTSHMALVNVVNIVSVCAKVEMYGVHAQRSTFAVCGDQWTHSARHLLSPLLTRCSLCRRFWTIPPAL
jgi:hypothetical protein